MSISVFPPRQVCFPTGQHETTVIFLHERDHTGPGLAEIFANHSGKKLFEQFPSTRWVFPSARAKYFYWTQADRGQLSQDNKDSTTEWFYQDSAQDIELESPQQLLTLQESASYILRIIDDEINRIGRDPHRVFVAGIGQGAALALVVLLCVHHKLGGFVCMDGWLPYYQTMSAMIENDQVDRAGAFFKSTFIAAAQQAYYERQRLQPPSGNPGATDDIAKSESQSQKSQAEYQPNGTDSIAFNCSVPDHIKQVPVQLGCSYGLDQRVSQAASILKRIGFERLSWGADYSKPEFVEGIEKDGNIECTALRPSISQEQLEMIVGLFKNLKLGAI